MYQHVAEGTPEHDHYSRTLDSNFHSLQTTLCIFACEKSNEAHVNEMIADKRKQLLAKLQRKMRRLNTPRTQELAGIMLNMLAHNDLDYLSAEHIPQKDFSLSQSLMQASVNAKARTRPDELRHREPTELIPAYRGAGATIFEEKKEASIAKKVELEESKTCEKRQTRDVQRSEEEEPRCSYVDVQKVEKIERVWNKSPYLYTSVVQLWLSW